ncbi:MAG: hypothetical protein GX136_08315 [Clostridiales bacterium]|nr:hypothetical protein [Clostridiales bacterium]
MNKNSLEHELACYYRQIKKQLVCKSAKKKKLIAELKGSIVEYLEDHSDSTIKNIAEHFGSPADIADSYISSMEGDELGGNLHKSRRVFMIAVIAAFIIIAMFSVLCLVEYFENKKSAQGYDAVTVQYSLI